MQLTDWLAAYLIYPPIYTRNQNHDPTQLVKRMRKKQHQSKPNREHKSIEWNAKENS